VVLTNQKKIVATKNDLSALQKLTDDRFLQGNLLNALQQATVPGVQLMRLRVDQTYEDVDATAPQTGDDGTVIPGRPGSATEKIVVNLDARDYSSNPGDEVDKFKDVISREPYFQTALDRTNGIRLMNLSPPQIGADGRPSVLFTLQCTYPDQKR
ncbi:MAG TPA: hypothetical protein VMA13_12560, partial [Candidatus Saccharimonadales bacterium]|nr:hypothetical protein [Candidatus Saccharimonadales bacterium]